MPQPPSLPAMDVDETKGSVASRSRSRSHHAAIPPGIAALLDGFREGAFALGMAARVEAPWSELKHTRRRPRRYGSGSRGGRDRFVVSISYCTRMLRFSVHFVGGSHASPPNVVFAGVDGHSTHTHEHLFSLRAAPTLSSNRSDGRTGWGGGRRRDSLFRAIMELRHSFCEAQRELLRRTMTEHVSGSAAFSSSSASSASSAAAAAAAENRPLNDRLAVELSALDHRTGIEVLLDADPQDYDYAHDGDTHGRVRSPAAPGG